MTDLRAAAQQGLEALEFMADEWGFTHKANRPERWQAITALRAALEQPNRAQRMRDAQHTRRPTLREMVDPEQPEQEPVAWMYVGLTFNNDMHGPHLVWKPEHMDAMSAEKGVVASPLYTHSPRREWRGLTEEEISALFPSHLRGDYKDLIPYSFARAIEAALKERNA